MIIAETERLILRRWRESDRELFAQINAGERVMEFMRGALTHAQSDGLADRIEAHFRRHRFGLYAVELRGDCPFIGYVGLAVPSFQAHFTPFVEIGWRLSADYWGKGLATEAARQIVSYASKQLGLQALVSFTVPANIRSRRVMEKLGMSRNPDDDFDHPGCRKAIRCAGMYSIAPSSRRIRAALGYGDWIAVSDNATSHPQLPGRRA